MPSMVNETLYLIAGFNYSISNIFLPIRVFRPTHIVWRKESSRKGAGNYRHTDVTDVGCSQPQPHPHC
jgi:hypothetical protein